MCFVCPYNDVVLLIADWISVCFSCILCKRFMSIYSESLRMGCDYRFFSLFIETAIIECFLYPVWKLNLINKWLHMVQQDRV